MLGSCLCGQVRFKVEGEPISSIVCHCASCRKASGAPSVGWVAYKAAKLQLFTGKLAKFQSSVGVQRSFCKHCGTPLFYENDSEPEMLDITIVSLDDPNIYAPTREVWLEHKISWEVVNSDIGQYPKGTTDGPYHSNDNAQSK